MAGNRNHRRWNQTILAVTEEMNPRDYWIETRDNHGQMDPAVSLIIYCYKKKYT